MTTGTQALTDQAIRHGADRAARHLLAHRTARGVIHRPCTGRAIETALTLHLLRQRSGHEEARGRLHGFCRRFWERPDDRSTRHPLFDLDHAVSRAVVAAVLDVPEKRALAARARAAWIDFGHPSGGRKFVFWSVLLRELDPGQEGHDEFAADRFRSPTDQKWAALIMTAIEAIGGHGTPAALEALAAEQLPDGSWMRHVLLTVTALIALGKTGRHEASVQRGVEFLVREMRPDGGIPFVPDLDIWVTALSGLILSGGQAPRSELEPLARYLVEIQLESGGWCFSTATGPADVDDTGLCLLFLERLDAARHAQAIHRARQLVLEMRNADGGFPTYVRGAPSEAELTARGLMVMAAEAGRYRAEIEDALRWLRGAQHTDGTFRMEWTLCAHYSIAQVLLAFAAVGRGESTDEMARRSVGYVLATQNADGGWGMVPGGASEVLPSSYALIALSHAPTTQHAAIRRGAEFLLDRQLADGGFRSPPDAVGPRPLIFEMDLFPTIYGLWGLVAALAALNPRANSRPGP